MNALRTLGLPRMYTQGPGATDRLGELLAPFPGPVAVVVDEFVRELLGRRIERALDAGRLGHELFLFGGECTVAEIERLTARARAGGCAAVLGVGGGKTLDSAKGTAKRLHAPLAIMPTVASNDAPTSRLIVVYDESHAIAGVERLPWNPDLVVVDSQVIADAPARFLRAGIGDAISKRFEAAQVRHSGGRNFFDTLPLESARSFADLAYATILEDAPQALADCERHAVTPALERLIESAVLASGVGFENGGLSIAHALTRGLTADAATRRALHGEMVAYGLLIQLRLSAGMQATLDELQTFYRRIGLPLELEDLMVDKSASPDIDRIAGLTAAAPYAAHFETALDAEAIAAAIHAHEQGLIR